MEFWVIAIIFLNGFIFGWIGGFNWATSQFIHCARNNIVMRIRHKYLFVIKPFLREG